MLARASLAVLVGVATLAGGSPGRIDRSFAGGRGFVRMQVGVGAMPASAGDAVVTEPDGKIAVAGTASDSAGRRLIFVARFGRDGRLDHSFARGGIVRLQLGVGQAPYSAAEALTEDRAGRLIVGGTATDVHEHLALMLARLDSRGRLDRSFGGGTGSVRLMLGGGGEPSSEVYGLAALPGGALVVSGSATDTTGHPGILVARFGPGGRLDRSFARSGYLARQLAAPSSHPASGVGAPVLQRDGKIVLAGSATDRSGAFRAMVARLTRAGRLDPAFGRGGYTIRQLGAGSRRVSALGAVIVQPGGKLVAAGEATERDSNPAFEHDQVLVARFDSNGRFDPSFGAGRGYVTAQLEGRDSRGGSSAGALTLVAGGRLLVVGTAAAFPFDELFLARFDSSGGLDRSFGKGKGYVTAQLGDPRPGIEYTRAYAAVASPDGKLVATGTANDRGLDDAMFLARFIDVSDRGHG